MAAKTAIKLLIVFTIILYIFMCWRTAAKMLLSVEFEVYGRVQGVFFRKFTKEKANELGVRGWCKNTRDGTVAGVAQGETEKVEEMKKWLSTVGSPYSTIDKCTFSNEKQISDYEFKDFSVRH